MVRTSRPAPNDVGWRRSSYSNQEGGNCVEVADGFQVVVPVRDSKVAYGPALCFEAASWAAFIGELKAGLRAHRPLVHEGPAGR
ncbi:DUF397 domain-containing protein [Streptomyces beigongshangae]|uniref:DUF397 domain-containing protein n=1 Tax=Streptomyces beigongshangae TaxID=2841597 RepID=UPI001C84BDAC|nr:DUF397 domain-containing protein [Streptomyces sp. REN17]